MYNLPAPNNMANTHKRKRDDAARRLEPRMATFRSTATLPPSATASKSAPPVQHAGDDQSLALEQVLKKAAAGKGEEVGMQVQELTALCLRHIKVLKEKGEIEKAVATMKLSGMQAAQRKMAEQLENRDKEILVLKGDLDARKQILLKVQRERDTLRSRIVRLETEQQRRVEQVVQMAYSDSDSGYKSYSEQGSEMLRSLKKVYCSYKGAVETLSSYLYRKLQERTGIRGYTMEFLNPLLEGFGIPESARVEIKAGYSSKKTLVWWHWISSVMFDGFEDHMFSLAALTGASTSTDIHSYAKFRHFRDRKYVEVFPQWLLQLFTQLPDVHRDEYGRFVGDEYLSCRFSDLAKEVWALHKLASSFHPPARLLRVDPGTVYQEPLQFWVRTSYEPNPANPVVVCMLDPGFRLGNEVIAARVLCS